MSVARAAQEYWLRRAARARKSLAESHDPPARLKLEKQAAEYEALATGGLPPGGAAMGSRE